MLAAAAPWFYWLALLLLIGAGLGIVATLIGYYVKVLSNKAPKRRRS